MRLILASLFLISLQGEAQISPALIEQFETAFQEYGNENQVIGVSIAIRTADDVWTDQFGISAESEPLTEDHLFAMGSVSKTITSATILTMYEDGLLTLEDPLHLYLDTYSDIDSTVTIRQLLNHTSGIYNYTNHPSFFQDVLQNPEEITLPEEVLANYVLSPDFVAGTNYTYSNTNYVLLGMVIEEISGQTYYEEARERFDFDTNYPSFALPPFEISTLDLAHLWADLDGFGVADIQASGTSLNNLFSGAGPAGAYVATPKGLSKWARDLYTGEILQSSTMAELLTPSAFNGNYGLGVEIISGGAIVSGLGFCSTDVVGHEGGIFYTTFTYYDAENDLSIAVQTNDAVTEADMRQLAFDLFCINDNFVVSIDEEIYTESLEVFPNPFIDQLTVSYELSTSRDVSLSLVDYTGKEIRNIDQSRKFTGAYQEEFTMDIPSGLYLLKLVIDDQITYKKIIKN